MIRKCLDFIFHFESSPWASKFEKTQKLCSETEKFLSWTNKSIRNTFIYVSFRRWRFWNRSHHSISFLVFRGSLLSHRIREWIIFWKWIKSVSYLVIFSPLPQSFDFLFLALRTFSSLLVDVVELLSPRFRRCRRRDSGFTFGVLFDLPILSDLLLTDDDWSDCVDASDTPIRSSGGSIDSKSISAYSTFGLLYLSTTGCPIYLRQTDHQSNIVKLLLPMLAHMPRPLDGVGDSPLPNTLVQSIEHVTAVAIDALVAFAYRIPWGYCISYLETHE